MWNVNFSQTRKKVPSILTRGKFIPKVPSTLLMKKFTPKVSSTSKLKLLPLKSHLHWVKVSKVWWWCQANFGNSSGAKKESCVICRIRTTIFQNLVKIKRHFLKPKNTKKSWKIFAFYLNRGNYPDFLSKSVTTNYLDKKKV